MDNTPEAPKPKESPKGIKGNVVALLEKVGLKKIKKATEEGQDTKEEEKTKHVDFKQLANKSYKDALKKLQSNEFHEEVRPVFARVDSLYPGKYDASTLRALIAERTRLLNLDLSPDDLANYEAYINPAINEVGTRIGIKTPEQLEAILSEPTVVEDTTTQSVEDDQLAKENEARIAQLYTEGIRIPELLQASHTIKGFDKLKLLPAEMKRKALSLQAELIEQKKNLRDNLTKAYEKNKQKIDDSKLNAEVQRHGAIIEDQLNKLALASQSTMPEKVRLEAHQWSADPRLNPTYLTRVGSVASARGISIADAEKEVLFEDFKNHVDTEVEPGSLGFHLDPHIKDRSGTILGPNYLYRYLLDPSNYKARDYLFNKIIYKVLTQRNRTSNDLYDLEDRRDMSTFLLFARQIGRRAHEDTVVNGVTIRAGEILPKDGIVNFNAKGEMRGRPLGDVLVENYEFQQDAINQSHDVDYWAAHAAGEMRQFQGSVAFYKNEYGEMAASDPVINAAYRAYEQALLMIRDSHNAYFPPAAIGYDPNNMTYYWDHLAEDIFKQYIGNGVVRKIERDSRTGLPKQTNNELNLTATTDNLKEDELDDLEVKRVLKLAKGYGVVSMRLLEIFANSKGPGSNHPKFGSDGFHSIPYEGMARHMQPMAHLMTKWKYGDVLFTSFFQQIIDPSGKKWNPADIQKIRTAAIEGRLDELFPGAKRLIDEDNLTNFSGAFGPMTKWRLNDAMKDWDEKDKLWLGGSMRMALAKGWADGKIDEELKRRAIDPESIKNPEGMDRMMDLQFHSGPYQEWYEDGHHGGVAKGHAHAEKLARAHNAMVWLQMVEWNPLLVARNLNLRRQNENGVFLDVTLRHHILDRLLGINLLRSDYRDNKTPNDTMRDELRRIAVLEADVAAVREKLINGQEHPRAVTLADIEGPDSAIKGDYIDPETKTTYVRGAITWNEHYRRQNVKKYFEMVHEEVTGELLDWTPGQTNHHTQHIMHHIGVYMNPHDPTDRKIHINWNNVLGHGSDHNIEHVHSRDDPTRHGLQDLVFRERNWLEATDDTSWRQLDLLNLGARQFLRRAGDLASHSEGNQELANYLNLLSGKPDMDKLVEQLQKSKAAFMGDGVDQAWKTGYLFSQATGRLFESRVMGSTWLADTFVGRMMMPFTSSCLAEDIYGSHHADNWTSNERRKWVDKMIDARILPPDALDAFGNRYEFNAHRLQRELNARDVNVIWETMAMGVAAAALLVLITALLNAAKGEEDGGGGGGHGH